MGPTNQPQANVSVPDPSHVTIAASCSSGPTPFSPQRNGTVAEKSIVFTVPSDTKFPSSSYTGQRQWNSTCPVTLIVMLGSKQHGGTRWLGDDPGLQSM